MAPRSNSIRLTMATKGGAWIDKWRLGAEELWPFSFVVALLFLGAAWAAATWRSNAAAAAAFGVVAADWGVWAGLGWRWSRKRR